MASSGSWVEVHCKVCKKIVDRNSAILVRDGNLYDWYCFSCSNYNQQTKTMDTRETWIRNSVPLAVDTPATIIADWLDDHSRHDDANYMRSRSG